MRSVDLVRKAAAVWRRSDHYLGTFSYYAAKVTATRFVDRGTGEGKPGAAVLAEYAMLSPDTVENHAVAFQLLVELHRRGYGRQARSLWRLLYKSHWIAAAKDWRHHRDLEIVLDDLQNFLTNRMSPEEAHKSKEPVFGLGELLLRHQASIERQIVDLFSAADKKRAALPKVRALKAAYDEHYKPAIEEALAALKKKAQ